MERLGEWAVVYLRNVSDAGALLKAVTDGVVECDVINAALVVSQLQLAVAAARHERGGAFAQTQGAGLMSALAPKPPNALAQFGFVPGAHSNMLIAARSPAGGDVAALLALVKGEQAPLSQLGEGCDEAAVLKVYGIAADMRQHSSLERCVINTLAIADI